MNPYRWLKPPAILCIPSGDNIRCCGVNGHSLVVSTTGFQSQRGITIQPVVLTIGFLPQRGIIIKPVVSTTGSGTPHYPPSPEGTTHKRQSPYTVPPGLGCCRLNCHRFSAPTGHNNTAGGFNHRTRYTPLTSPSPEGTTYKRQSPCVVSPGLGICCIDCHRWLKPPAILCIPSGDNRYGLITKPVLCTPSGDKR